MPYLVNHSPDRSCVFVYPSLLMFREPQRSEGPAMGFGPSNLAAYLCNSNPFGLLLLSHGVPPGLPQIFRALWLPAQA